MNSLAWFALWVACGPVWGALAWWVDNRLAPLRRDADLGTDVRYHRDEPLSEAVWMGLCPLFLVGAPLGLACRLLQALWLLRPVARRRWHRERDDEVRALIAEVRT